MSLNVYKITTRQLHAIADGTSTAADLSILVSGQRSKCLAMLALIARMAQEAGHPEAAIAATGWRLLAHVQRKAPGAAEVLLRYPAVSAWATHSVLALNTPSTSGAEPGRLALVAAAAAIRGKVSFTVQLPPIAGADSALHLPSLGSVLLPGRLRGKPVVLRHCASTTVIADEQAKVVLPYRLLGADTSHWRGLATVTVGSGDMRLRLVIDDADPYRLTGYGGSLERLTACQRDEWRRRMSGGWDMLTRDHRRTAADVLSLIGAITPLATTDGAMRSITSRHVFGTIGLSLPDDDLTMALTLAHEVQHAKLSALMDLLPLVDGSSPVGYYAPWRLEPRPLASLLQGMYAHLGVARFWQRHLEVTPEPTEVHHAYVEFARWRSACEQVAKVVSVRPELTRCGSAFVDGMMSVLRGWRHEYVPQEARTQADQAASQHRKQWDMLRHGDDGTSPSDGTLELP
jgi:HEXXH motif-containing protein